MEDKKFRIKNKKVKIKKVVHVSLELTTLALSAPHSTD